MVVGNGKEGDLFFFLFRTFGERGKKCIYLLELEKALLSKEIFYFNICNGFSEILNISVRTLQLNLLLYLKGNVLST